MGLLDDARAALAAEDERKAHAAAAAAAEAERLRPQPVAPHWGVKLAEVFAEVGVPQIPIRAKTAGAEVLDQGWGMLLVHRILHNGPSGGEQHYFWKALSAQGRFWDPANYSGDSRDGGWYSAGPATMHVDHGSEWRSGGTVMSDESLAAWTKLALYRQERGTNAFYEGVVVGQRTTQNHDDWYF